MSRGTTATAAAAILWVAAVSNSLAQSGAQNSAPPSAKTSALASATAATVSGSFGAEDITAGGIQYNRTCAQCHGRNMVNSGTSSYDLRRFPVDQADRFLLSVSKGKGNMPSFEAALTPEQIKVLWAYVGSRAGKEP